MNTTSSAVRRWRKIIRDQQASGLSVAEYGRQTRLPAWSLYSWRHRLRAERKASAKFVEVQVARPHAGSSAEGQGPELSGVELHLPGRRCVVVRRGFHGPTLLALLHVLEANPVGRQAEEADA